MNCSNLKMLHKNISTKKELGIQNYYDKFHRFLNLIDAPVERMMEFFSNRDMSTLFGFLPIMYKNSKY